MSFCTTCGTNNEDVATFCGSCGTSLKVITESDGLPSKQPPMDNQSQDQSQEQPQKPQYQQPQQQPQYQQPQYQQPQQPYQQPIGGYDPPGYALKPPRTGWLTFTLVINWIGIAFIALFALLIFAIASAFQSLLGVGGGAIAFFGFIFLAIAGLLAWLTLELNKYNATARTLQIVLSALVVVGSLSNIADNIFVIALSGLQIYALAFHEATIKLFKPYG